MRIAVISDIHGNLTALDAVIADIRRHGVEFVVHGGDLVTGCTRPAAVIDRVRQMNWPGVFGNTDEMGCKCRRCWIAVRRRSSSQLPRHRRWSN